MKRLKTWRKTMGLKQTDIARKLQVTPYSVYRWETGRAIPSMFHLKKLCKIFDCTFNELLND